MATGVVGVATLSALIRKAKLGSTSTFGFLLVEALLVPTCGAGNVVDGYLVGGT